MTTWFEAIEPGTFDVLCSQYCGTRHSLMRAQVVALAGRRLRALARGGARRRWRCPARKGDGQGLAGAWPRGRGRARLPALPLGRRLAVHRPDLGERVRQPPRTTADGRDVLVDEAYLTESMMDPRAVIAAGLPAGDAVVSGRAVARARPRRSSSTSGRCARRRAPTHRRRRRPRRRSLYRHRSSLVTPAPT